MCADTPTPAGPPALMLTTTVALHDVDDVEAFVQATLNTTKIGFEAEERDELVAEGIALMYELAAKFEPHRPGYATAGRFSGYAAMFLPRRLGDVWHRLHPEHCYVTRPDGTREWEYLERPVSLDGLRQEAAGRGRGDIEARLVPRGQWTRPAVAA